MLGTLTPARESAERVVPRSAEARQASPIDCGSGVGVAEVGTSSIIGEGDSGANGAAALGKALLSRLPVEVAWNCDGRPLLGGAQLLKGRKPDDS